MRKLTAVILATFLLAAACGDDDDAADDAAPVDPASIESCEELADATIAMTQDIIDELGALTPEELTAVSGGEITPAFQALADRGAAIGTRAQELACDNIDALVTERADRLEAEPDNAIGQLVIEGVKTGEDVLARLFRN